MTLPAQVLTSGKAAVGRNSDGLKFFLVLLLFLSTAQLRQIFATCQDVKLDKPGRRMYYESPTLGSPTFISPTLVSPAHFSHACFACIVCVSVCVCMCVRARACMRVVSHPQRLLNYTVSKRSVIIGEMLLVRHVNISGEEECYRTTTTTTTTTTTKQEKRA